MDTRPPFTSAISVVSKLWYWLGSMTMSIPAFTAVRTWVGQSPGIW